ncbi:MFS transporter [Streptomyces sp. SP17BM10]|uniref:MFS transporter n=1 Tax=Streptomyces sp. SP17BM10 TaxID=3002530 RepID=UPI002E7757A9|nr:MFS transporter [Streptomyces sp. SP17BM10]MEE1781897.1 MFS transporter [Streptomyces sp. SP17BM10]
MIDTAAHHAVRRRKAPSVHAALPDPRRWRVLPVILLATFMAAFDYMVVNVAAPSLARDLGAGPAALELVVGGYGFTYAAGLVTGGKLGDLFGHRRLFLLGMAGFTAASLLCGLAASAPELIAARLVQGLAAAAMAPQVLALITAAFPAGERPRALAWFGLTISLGGIAGQVLGGALLQADVFGLGWRVIFLVNGPVGVGALAAAARLLPRRAPAARPGLDPVGALALTLALALALVPLVVGREEGWPLWSVLSLVAAVPALAAALAWMRRLDARGGEPLLDLALFASRALRIGLLVNVAVMASFGGLMLTTTLLLQGGLGLDAAHAGLVFVPLGAGTMAAALLGRHLAARLGSRALPAGNALGTAGITLLALELHLAGASAGAPLIAAPLALVGLGSGLTMPALTGTVLGGVRPERAGAASGILTTTQQFSTATGVAVLGAVFFSVLGHHPTPAGYANAAEHALWLAALLYAVATVLVTRLPRPQAPATAPAPAPAAKTSVSA